MSTQNAVAVAWKYFKSGDRRRAEHVARQLHRSEPKNSEISFLLGVIAQSDRRNEEAVEHFNAAVTLREDYAEAHNNLGNALANQGKLHEAVVSYRCALEKRPEYPEAYNNLGNALRQLGELHESQRSLEKALELRPEYPEALNNIGLTTRALGRHDDAVRYFRRALMHRPDYPEASNNLGIAYALRGKLEEAVTCFETAVARNPKYVEALSNMGMALLQDGQADRAREALERALALDPQMANGHKHLGDCWSRMGEAGRAVACYERALQLDPRYGAALLSLGKSLLAQKRRREALDRLDAAARLEPRVADVHVQRGVALLQLGQVHHAERAFTEALKCDPDHIEAHVKLAEALLARGENARGWNEFEWRLKTEGAPSTRVPRWQGESLEGKSLLILSEGGESEAIQFARFAAELTSSACKVLYECPDSLAELIEQSGCGRIVPVECSEEADFAVPRLSLLRLSEDSALSVPTQPYLKPAKSLVEEWQERLSHVNGLKVGIVWQSSEAADENSYPVAYFGFFAGLPNVTLVSLVSDPTESDRQWLKQHNAIHCPAEDYEDASLYSQQAALISTLDLVIGVDSPQLHLAGALGIQTWAILPISTHWRWQLGRDDSPWYSSVRLFRRMAGDSPALLFKRVADELAKRTETPTPLDAKACTVSYDDCGRTLDAEGRFGEAAECFRQALLGDWSNSTIHLRLGNCLRKIGKVESAIEHYEIALQLNSNYAEAANSLGIALAAQGAHSQAIERFRQAIELDGSYAHAYSNFGVALMDMRRIDEAITHLEEAIRLQPDFARAHANLGLAHARVGNHERARNSYETAVELWPGDVESRQNLAVAQRELGLFEEAIKNFEQVLEDKPDFFEAYNNLGITYAKQEKFDRAIDCYRHALRLNPTYADAHNNLGIALGRREERAAAVASYREALRLRPDYAEAHNNLGIILTEMEEHAQAIQHFEEALRLRPGYAAAHSNLGIALAEQGEIDLALVNYDEAIRLAQDYPEGHMNRALSLLQRERLAEGWEEYEWRWKCKDVNMPPFEQPLWDGVPLDGRTIALHAEQGLGDTLQFIRYARNVADRGGRVVAMVQKPLIKLLERTPGIDRLLPKEGELPACDTHSPLLSLPRLLPNSLSNPDDGKPYIFTDPGLVQQWSRELSSIRELKIGINWQGNPRYRGDRHRSIPLVHFAPLAHINGIRLISLQKNFGTDQLGDLQRTVSVLDLGGQLDENTAPFMETAAVMLNLDLFITSDTAVAHLAGGLGIPVWLALSKAADWRWFRDRENSPWYPSMRIFRQRKLGNWGDVFDQIAAELSQLAASNKATRPIRVEVAAGELIDKITILEIKRQRLSDVEKLRNVEIELAELMAAKEWSIPDSGELASIMDQLREVNETLWCIEDDIRDCERQQDFAPTFVRLARDVYKTNDKRAELKRVINTMVGSRIVEEKGYAAY